MLYLRATNARTFDFFLLRFLVRFDEFKLSLLHSHEALVSRTDSFRLWVQLKRVQIRLSIDWGHESQLWHSMDEKTAHLPPEEDIPDTGLQYSLRRLYSIMQVRPILLRLSSTPHLTCVVSRLQRGMCQVEKALKAFTAGMIMRFYKLLLCGSRPDSRALTILPEILDEFRCSLSLSFKKTVAFVSKLSVMSF